MGFYYEAHRARVDCQAGIHILSKYLPSTDEPALLELINKVNTKTVIVYSEKAPFEKKDALKKVGYKWFAGNEIISKCWHVEVPDDQLNDELSFLRNEIYQDPNRSIRCIPVTAKERFSKRG